MYNYAADWMTSRAAWISSKWFSEYTPSAKIGDVDGDGEVTVMDATLVQKYIVSLETLTDSQLLHSSVFMKTSTALLTQHKFRRLS